MTRFGPDSEAAIPSPLAQALANRCDREVFLLHDTAPRISDSGLFANLHRRATAHTVDLFRHSPAATPAQPEFNILVTQQFGNLRLSEGIHTEDDVQTAVTILGQAPLGKVLEGIKEISYGIMQLRDPFMDPSELVRSIPAAEVMGRRFGLPTETIFESDLTYAGLLMRTHGMEAYVEQGLVGINRFTGDRLRSVNAHMFRGFEMLKGTDQDDIENSIAGFNTDEHREQADSIALERRVSARLDLRARMETMWGAQRTSALSPRIQDMFSEEVDS